ncbi:MAG: glycoside hydrolase family 9 protein [candidate division KSB1 bacterium]|nr:glycoside hydrolase family 9 protein [candidate division KSB1 bacterium]
MKQFSCILMLSVLLPALAAAGDLPDMPMRFDPANTMEYLWAQKPVLESRSLSGMESMDEWRHEGFGSLRLSRDQVNKGETSLLLTCPTKGKEPGDENGRPFGAARAVYPVDNQDWSDWNRISFQVYPDLPGFRTVVLSLVFHNDGEEKVPGPYDRNGLNYVLLENGKWNEVYWEIEHLGRDQVTAVELRYRLQGNEPGATDTAAYYFDEMNLEKVEPDHYEGWNVAPGQIAYSHVGYALDFPKTALVSDVDAKQFSLLNVKTGATVLEKRIDIRKTPLGRFQVLDFSEINAPGTYVLSAGTLQTRPFRIASFDDLYRSTIVKSINHFYCQRCGTEVPGIHNENHRDWTCTHGDSTIMINGGWHDAGDLSQGLTNTSEAVYAMLRLAETYPEPDLSQRLKQEAEWGLDWVLKTRFGNGYRCTWATMDFWTDGILGNVDDVSMRARHSSYDNFVAAKTEAMAGMALQDTDAFKADYALQCAREDWRFARQRHRYFNIDVAAAALNASLTLYEATGEEPYKDAAAEYADYILACQQSEPLSKGAQFKGFFYRDSTQQEILHYAHRGHEQESVMGLVRLLELFPESPNAENWESAVRMYAEYYKQISVYTDPYFMIPAGIYDLRTAEDKVEKEQIKNGVKLDPHYYLKRFPVWKTFRGNCGTSISQTKGLVRIGRYLNDRDLMVLGYHQLQWVLGRNPFNQSLMYGEGYRFASQYSAMSGDIVGGLPVGVQTHFNRDEPYWPTENCYNWKEIWVHPSSRWLWIMSDFYAE